MQSKNQETDIISVVFCVLTCLERNYKVRLM